MNKADNMSSQKRINTSAKALGSAWLALVALVGCSQLQPYTRPDLAVPTEWQNGAAPAQPAAGQTAANLSWQDFVREPALRTLVEQALARNHDLRLAVLQIEQARAQFQIKRADVFPTLNAGLTGSRQTTGENSPIKSTWTAGALVNAWEIDLFGRLASLSEAAQAQYLATEENRKAVQISLVAAVASGWFNLQASEAQWQLARQTLDSRESSLRLVRLRYDNGAASALDLQATESLAAAARVALAQQDRQRQLDANALALLVGNAVLPQTSGLQGPDASASLADVPLGLPSQVLLQRPDVKAAEQQLVAANAQIGAARAAFFPRISLTASAGSASSELSGLFKAGSWGWTIAPQALLPIFDAGRNQAGLDSAKAAREVALVQYDKAIQSAFREVNDALAGQSTLQEQWAAQQALVMAESERLRLTELRYQQGVASQLEWLDAQRSLFTAKQALLQTQLALAQNKVALYKALGGGWKAPA